MRRIIIVKKRTCGLIDRRFKMIIQDADTKEKFEISNEKVENIKEMYIGELTPEGLLDFFSTFSSRGKNGKKRAFVYEEDMEKVQKWIGLL